MIQRWTSKAHSLCDMIGDLSHDVVVYHYITCLCTCQRTMLQRISGRLGDRSDLEEIKCNSHHTLDTGCFFNSSCIRTQNAGSSLLLF